MLHAFALLHGVRREIDQLVTTAGAALEAAPLADGWRQRLGEMAAQVAHRDR